MKKSHCVALAAAAAPVILYTLRRGWSNATESTAEDMKDARIDYAWGGTLAITRSRLPFFGRLTDNIVTASGYSGHGIALATLAGEVLADAIAGTHERFELMSSLPTPAFPCGGRLRSPLLALAMGWYAMRDRLGI